MRKLTLITILIFALCAISGNALAVDWVKADSKIVAFDAPTTFYDGTPLPADIQGLIFSIYTKDPNGQNIVMEFVTNAETATITILEGGKKHIGVSAMYIDVDGIASPESTIAWSDNPIDCQDGITFGIHNLKRPDKTKNLRLP
jgi:hypothetical protein